MSGDKKSKGYSSIASSMIKKQWFMRVDRLSFYSIVIGCYSSIGSIYVIYLVLYLQPTNTWYISYCFLAAFCITCKWRLNSEERRAPAALENDMVCTWLGEM